MYKLLSDNSSSFLHLNSIIHSCLIVLKRPVFPLFKRFLGYPPCKLLFLGKKNKSCTELGKTTALSTFILGLLPFLFHTHSLLQCITAFKKARLRLLTSWRQVFISWDTDGVTPFRVARDAAFARGTMVKHAGVYKAFNLLVFWA